MSWEVEGPSQYAFYVSHMIEGTIPEKDHRVTMVNRLWWDAWRSYWVVNQFRNLTTKTPSHWFIIRGVGKGEPGRAQGKAEGCEWFEID